LITLRGHYPQYQPLLYRKWKSRNLKIMQFNMCADGLIGIYTKEPNDKTFLGVDKKNLEWTYRGLKIIEAILQYDCDVICLQECDAMEFFGRYLDKYGYSWIFQPKNDSPIKKKKFVNKFKKKEMITILKWSLMVLPSFIKKIN